MIPERADVVIIGGGIIGCSIAYHLTKLGITDVLLLERRQLCCGTTWHSVGSVAELRGSRRMTELARYTAELYRSLEAETGQATGYRRTGSIMLALNEERLLETKRIVALARAFGQEAEMISLADVRERCPQVKTSDALAGLFLPTDGRTNPIDTTQALAKGARQRGARILENAPVEALDVQDGRMVGVVTPEGPVRAEVVVLATGMWSRDFAARFGVSLPLQAAEHFYAITEPIAGLPQNMPFIRVPDESTYYKEDAGKLLFGCLEKRAKPWALDGIPADFCFDSLPEDLDHFEPILTAAVERFPLLEKAGIKIFFNGPESFTPDGNALVGETPELKNLFVACGMNTVGVMAGGGIGRTLAEWIRDRQRPEGFAEFDVARTSAFQSGRNYLRDRTVEALGVLYDLGFPNREHRSARGGRRLPLHDRHIAAGAVMGSRAGWEIPLVFAPPGRPAEILLSYGRQNWVPWAADESRAAQADLVLFDLSAGAKLEVAGHDAGAVLARLSATRGGGVDAALWLTDAGRIESRLTAMRLSDGTFLLLSIPGSERRHGSWIDRDIRAGEQVAVREATSVYAVLLLAGPDAGSVLAAAGARGLAVPSPSRTEIGYAPAYVIAWNDLGCQGWLVVVPSEFAGHVVESLETACGGKIRLGGEYALESLRIAAGRPAWPKDLDDTVTPLEAGLGAEIAWESLEFIGRDAIMKARETGSLTTRLAHFTLRKDRLALYGQECILRGGKPVGLTTSAGWALQPAAPMALGYVSDPSGIGAAWLDEADIAIDVAGEIVPADATLVGGA